MEPALLVIRVGDDVDEALAIAREAGFNIKDVIRVKNINSRCYLGLGALERARSLINGNDIKKICVYDELKPRHITCLMKELEIDVIDKVMMILTVFQSHAGSRESLLQIEMARLRHQLPLIRSWIKKAKMGELPGFLSLGRYAIDVYYKHITKRIARLSKELEKLREKRSIEREMRRRQGFIHIAIAGYTNAGKTTLFNTLTNLVKPTGIEMFTTLSPKSYMIKMCGNSIVLVDTIGFIKSIPLDIIEAFKAVLEEISNADIILLVVDGSKKVEQLQIEIQTAFKILIGTGCIDKPIVIALNKIDNINKDYGNIIDLVKEISNKYRAYLIDVVPISALKRININNLKEVLCRTVESIQMSLT